jgi:hypothetical protein
MNCAYCVECGKRVPLKLVDGKWHPLQCKYHPKAKRYRMVFAAKRFNAMREAAK